jgi:hypothetical protein
MKFEKLRLIQDQIPKRKSTVYGLNGLRPTLRVGTFKSSIAFRALAPAASFRGSLCFASLSGQKIWHTIFFSSKANFKIFAKLLPKRRGASPSPKSSPAMVLPRYPAWNT